MPSLTSEGHTADNKGYSPSPVNSPPSNQLSPRRITFASPDITEEDIEAIVRVLRSGWITTGDECLALERELAEYLGCRNVLAVSSCTAALEIALASLRLPAGCRVGVPTWTFVATALAAVHQRLIPVLLDVDADTLNLAPVSLEAALEDGLRAVLPVHFGGVPVDPTVHQLCRDAGVPVIEDAAHALGAADFRGMINGSASVAACFSFYATKNLTAGEGGCLATEDDEVAEFARSYRLHGLSADAWARYRPESIDRYDIVGPGIKANLADPLAALARSQLKRFDMLQSRRRANVERYRENLASVEGLEFVPRQLCPTGADHLMVVLLPESAPRASVMLKLADAGVSTSIHFQPLHRFDWFKKNALLAPGGLDVADQAAGQALSLPLHARLTAEDVDRACDVLMSALSA